MFMPVLFTVVSTKLELKHRGLSFLFIKFVEYSTQQQVKQFALSF